MMLKTDWREVIKRAWSVRLMALAALLSAAEVAVPFFAEFLRPGMFAALSALTVAGAFVARIMAQKDLT